MNLLADESVDRQIVEALRAAGHNVLYVAEMEPGIGDPIVLAQARQRADVLLTADKDFGELVFRQGLATGGVVLLRLAGLSAEAKAGAVADAFHRHGAEMPDAFTVVSPGLIRIRRQLDH